MKMTIDLPDELVREVKLRAVMQGRTVKDLVAERLSESLGLTSLRITDRPVGNDRVDVDSSGLPTIRCASDAPAARMGVEELLELEIEAETEGDLRNAGLAD